MVDTIGPFNETDALMYPAREAFAVTPHDVTDFAHEARALYVGGAGDITLVTQAGSVVLFTAIPAGTILPVRCTRINATATDATNIVGLI